ncbi:uracil permease [Bacillus subtilis]|nr:Uracil permease [Bacillus subtilis]ASB69652.1 Uracil permease [Bacillus subtilis subsp. subtilis]POD86649.1 Uracil permease [Bacillus subtilis subsp. subtilis]BAI85175.2 uracil permease [Bacillus subtilis subsp. natto BEST195]
MKVNNQGEIIMSKKKVNLGVRDVPTPFSWVSFSLQHLFAMFGSTILVPKLVGMSPAVALVTSGIGTLAYLLITKGQIPAYLGSSFAFISPIILVKATGGPGAAMVGAFLAGLVYGLIALLIRQLGTGWLIKILPPVVVGPVIIVIGLGLASTAVNMAMYADPNASELVYSLKHFSVAGVTLAITIICAIFLRGFLSLIPVLIGIIGGYLFALTQGIVNFQPVLDAKWFAVPEFIIPFKDYSPSVTLGIAAAMVPVAFVTMSEHIGHQMVLSKVVGQDFIKKPGLHRSIMGDSVATILASLIGGPPTTTYGENIGVLAITRVFSVFVIGGAAVIACCFGFIGKISALISSVPSAVMGGVSFLLFGIIASSGLRMLIDNKIDYENNRNLIITSVILVIGVGGAFIQVSQGGFQVSGMALAAIVGVILNLILPQAKEEQTDTSEHHI